MANKKGKEGFHYDGVIISSPRLLVELKHDENQYIVQVVRISKQGKRAFPKNLYCQKLSYVFEILYDILVKEHLVTASGLSSDAIKNIRDACQTARNDLLEAVEKLTGERRVAQISDSVA